MLAKKYITNVSKKVLINVATLSYSFNYDITKQNPSEYKLPGNDRDTCQVTSATHKRNLAALYRFSFHYHTFSLLLYELDFSFLLSIINIFHVCLPRFNVTPITLYLTSVP